MIKGMVFAERYKLVDYLGQGGMSLVYRAVDIRTGHNVAIKILKSEYNNDVEFLERFQREAHAAGRMSHHNIVNLLDVGTEGDFRYLVLEYISGNTLKDIITEKGALNPNTAIQITIRILSALQHAHENGIIHRDIKPQNVLVNTNGHIKVADFGIARITNTRTISKKDVVIGSVHYSSPEQARGNIVQATSDIYSTGIVLYEMLTGRVPFVGDNPVTVAMQQVNATPPPIRDLNPSVPPAIASVVMKALEKSPQRRFQSAREMADALLKAKEGVVIEPAPPIPVGYGKDENGGSADAKSFSGNPSSLASARTQPPKKRPPRRNRVTILSTILVTCLLLAGLTIGIIAIYHSVLDSTVAPDIVGLTVQEAMTAAKRADLLLDTSNEVNHDTIPANVVIDQTPAADTDMHKGDSIVATISLGPATLLMPDLNELTRDEAVAKLKDRKVTVLISRAPSTMPVDTVIAQKPEKNQPYIVGQEIELTLSGGSAIIPELTNLTFETAQTLIDQDTLKIGVITLEKTEVAESNGVVLSQTPIAGSVVTLDTNIAMTVGVPSALHSAVVSVPIPEMAEAKELSVSLVIGDYEEQVFQGMTRVGQAYTAVVLISVAEEGTYMCHAYLDGEMILEQEVELH
ncbi:MAG TPA: Stk1 family PASTA domain-containing Ser/Thr kinase [Candidatus Limiplasma sp.]|nr:Stk1 family PASTA domain-containing Ser/Thr kinase [Candidatus Limiplasma sp.]HRX08442.1 Stk1 family PASTA domain-containing Ser/Thr kinase [Candidatus Limiplasma sp.]